MDKILVEVYIPASGDTYDIFIPTKTKLYNILPLLANTMSELSQGHFKATADTIICERRTGEILDINMEIKELGLTNGIKLMLM